MVTQAQPGLLVGRRSILQSIPAIMLAPAISGMAMASGASTDASSKTKRRLRIDHKFVLFPINNEASSRRVRVVKDGRVMRSFTAPLGLPAHWWAHLDVSAWQGKTLTLSLESEDSPPTWEGKIAGRGASETDNVELVAAVRTSPEIWSPETLYKEPLRPAFHFTARRGWNNDPNGLLYHAGQYHLFFQHNPYGLRWGNAHWGHAVSADLVHWKELPIALYPRGEDDFPYSGSAVVDHDNTSAWGKDGVPPMVSAFTSTGRGECIAFSLDDGASWTEFEGNPIVKRQAQTGESHSQDISNRQRDPRLLWHPPTKQWVMAVYSQRSGADGIAFYTSADFKSWRERSWTEGYFECPDLFPLPVDGDANRMKWILTSAPGYYSIGEFDGARFTPETPRLPAPAAESLNTPGKWDGPVFCAAQTFSNHPQGHRVQIAWGLVAAGDSPFTQLMSVPTMLSLRTTVEGVRLCREPVDALRSLRTRTYDFPAGPLTTSALLADLKGDAWDIESVISVGSMACPVAIHIGSDEYVYRPSSQMLIGPKMAMSIPLNGERLRFRILVDRTTVEIFGDHGQAYGMFLRSKPGGLVPLELRTLWGAVRLETLSVHSLRSAWTT
jgi:fructan beta-fructosidase